MATRVANMMRAFQLTTVGAFLIRLDRKRIVAATHAAFGRRCFSFGDSHFGTCSISNLIVCPTLYARYAALASKARIGIKNAKLRMKGR
jgi:hypothetical protein